MKKVYDFEMPSIDTHLYRISVAVVTYVENKGDLATRLLSTNPAEAWKFQGGQHFTKIIVKDNKERIVELADAAFHATRHNFLFLQTAARGFNEQGNNLFIAVESLYVD